MKYNKILLLLLFFSSLLLYPVQAQAQENSKSYELAEESTMKITGTSTIHDWEAEVKSFSLDLQASPSLTGGGKSLAADNIAETVVSVPVEQIESGKGGMNKKIYDALKKDKHPAITFRLRSVPSSDTKPKSDTTSLTVSGDLSIAGTSKPVDVDVKAWRNSDGIFRFSGSRKIDMTRFNVEPPTAMFGTIKAGKEVTVIFDLFVKEE